MDLKERIARAIEPSAWETYDLVEKKGYKVSGANYGDFVLKPVRTSKEAADRIIKELYGVSEHPMSDADREAIGAKFKRA